LADRLSRLNESLAKKLAAREEYERTLQATEDAYQKILDSSSTLLEVLKKERDTLSKKRSTIL